jgi:hypothetical protein
MWRRMPPRRNAGPRSGSSRRWVPPAGSLTGGADTLHEAVGGVERYEFEEQFCYGRDGRGPGSRFGEWLVRP